MGVDKKRPVYSIGVASDLVGVKPYTLRYYEQMGLIGPFRTPGNTRLYSEYDVEVCQYIRYLIEDEGVNVAGVRIILTIKKV
ncbi:MAG: MerR family transcriptional regulator [Bacillota bacterium]|jgi:MerR family transcriptional regulator/heat shock protein HspR